MVNQHIHNYELHKSMIDYVYENNARDQLHSFIIWIKFKIDNRYTNISKNITALALKLLFNNVILENFDKYPIDDNRKFEYFDCIASKKDVTNLCQENRISLNNVQLYHSEVSCHETNFVRIFVNFFIIIIIKQ